MINIVLLSLGFVSIYADFPSSFDEVTTESFAGPAGRDIGWTKVMSCSGATNAEVWQYPLGPGNKGTDIMDYAITFKIIPKDSSPSDTGYYNNAVYGKVCQNAVFSLNNNKMISFQRNTQSLATTGFMSKGQVIDDNFYTQTAEAANRLWNSCPENPGSDARTTTAFETTIYWACNNGGGLHISPDKACGWGSGGGSSIDIYFGYDANKREICDGNGDGTLMDAPPNCGILAVDNFLLKCSAEFEGHTNDISKLESDIISLNADIAVNTPNIATNTGNIATNTGNIAQNAADIVDLESVNTAVNNKITALESDIAQNAAGIKDLATFGNAAHANELNSDGVFESNTFKYINISFKDLFIVLVLLINTICIFYIICSRSFGNKYKKGYSVIQNESDIEPLKMNQL